jgi:hypothetical protein
MPTAATKFRNVLCGRKDIIKIGVDISKGGVVHGIVRYQAFCSQSGNKSSAGTKQTIQKQRFLPHTLHQAMESFQQFYHISLHVKGREVSKISW